MTYDDPSYQLYYIPAVFVLVTVVILTPLILLDYPLKALEWCVMRVKWLRKFYPNDKVHLFLNMFQGCYRNKMRFFAGLYFLFRFALNVSCVLTIDWLQQLLVQQLATIIMVLLLILCRPYEWPILNYVDAIIFINLAILNSLSFYLYSFTIIYHGEDLPISVTVLQYFLVFLPLVYMIAYICWRVTQPCHPKIKRIISKFSKRGADKDESESDEAMFDRAESKNTYARTKQPLSCNEGDAMTENTRLLAPHADSQDYSSPKLDPNKPTMKVL